MWKSSIYQFNLDDEDEHQANRKKMICIDVTNSAPKSMKIPGKQLSAVLKNILDGKPKTTKILDLGAARLRNTLYLLEKGYQLYAAEFKELFRTQSASDILTKAKSYTNFKKIVFPDEFIADSTKYDSILLINVPTVMPFAFERLILLILARQKLSDDGFLLWYSDPLIRNKKVENTRKILDGYLAGKERKKVETFYVELLEKDIETMLNLTGFTIDEKKSLELQQYANNNIVYFARIREKIYLDDLIVNMNEYCATFGYNPDNKFSNTEFPNLLEILGNQLKMITPGNDNASKYQYIIAYILRMLFYEQLDDMELETKEYNGLQRIDVTFQRQDHPGFFKDLQNIHQIPCSYIKIECKNYSTDPGNPEYDQLNTRLKEDTGMFGFLVIRQIENKENCLQHCINRKNGHKHYIIVLEDDDIQEMIKLKVRTKIDKFLSEKLKRLKFESLT